MPEQEYRDLTQVTGRTRHLHEMYVDRLKELWDMTSYAPLNFCLKYGVPAYIGCTRALHQADVSWDLPPLLSYGSMILGVVFFFQAAGEKAYEENSVSRILGAGFKQTGKMVGVNILSSMATAALMEITSSPTLEQRLGL